MHIEEDDRAQRRTILAIENRIAIQERFFIGLSRVGRLTRIVLYGAAGGYPRPTLGGNGGAS